MSAADLAFRVKVALRRRQAIRAVFMPRGSELSDDAEIVLADMKRAGFIDRPTTAYDRDGRLDRDATLMNEGARRLALRYFQALHMSDEKLHRMMDATEAV